MMMTNQFPDPEQLLQIEISEGWSENFKEEMLFVKDSLEDLITVFADLEDAIEWLKKSVESLNKTFSEYELLESYARRLEKTSG